MLAVVCSYHPAQPALTHPALLAGNVPRHPAAEFNCFADPDAASIVLAAYTHAVLITNECCQRVSVPWETVADWRAGDNDRAHFLTRVAEFSKQVRVLLASMQ